MVFVEFGVIGCNVIGSFVVGGVFKFYVWKFFGDFDGWVYVVEGCGEDDVVVFVGKMFNGVFCIWVFCYVF